MKNLRPLLFAAAGAAALVFSSCTYDPYYSSSSIDGSYSSGYSSGYGQGYGYGGRSFNSSLFISTGNPRWGYDPSSYSYYDFSSRRYYDPYLNGFYPIGYRPRMVYGTPHPHGWRPGRSFIAPPRRVTNITVGNYRDREAAYRNLDYSWARDVRRGQQQSRPDRYQESRPNFNNSIPNRRENQRNDRRDNRFDDRPSRFNRPVNNFERQQAPQLGNPGRDGNLERPQNFARPQRQQNFERPQRQENFARPELQRPNQEGRRMMQQAQPEAQRKTQREARPQMQERPERREKPSRKPEDQADPAGGEI